MRNVKKYILSFYLVFVLFPKVDILAEKSNDNLFVLYKTLNRERSFLSTILKQKYNTNTNILIKGTSGEATLHELIATLLFIKQRQSSKQNILSEKEATVLLESILKILNSLIIIKSKDIYNSNWQVTLSNIDKNLFGYSEKSKNVESLLELIDNLEETMKIYPSKKPSQIIVNIRTKFLELDTKKGKSKVLPGKVPKMIFDIKVNFLIAMIINRGILYPNCTWFEINDILLKDKSGIDVFSKSKRDYGKPLVPINMLGKDVYLVNDNNFIKQILDQSPEIFGVGEYKKLIFRSFMKKNVGISEGLKWKNRRDFNNKVLCEKHRHTYANFFNKAIKETLAKEGCPKNATEFMKVGKLLVGKIVFNDKNIPEEVFNIFDKANDIRSLVFEDFHIDEKTMNTYLNYVKANIKTPQPHSLVELGVKYIDYCPTATVTKDELLYQIPHWMFPTLGSFSSIVPRLLLLLANHPKSLLKLKKEINNSNIETEQGIYGLSYLRKCILETLRLNNTVVTMLRTLKKDYNFGKDGLGREYKFEKGTQFVILTNPILREPEKFLQPNKFIPERWDKELEKSYYSIMFSQGPQNCPGKELAIFMIQSYIAHYLKNLNFKIKSRKINTEYIEQMINPCKIEIYSK